jgi:osmoprotectant transport system ATP-binding protein
MGVELQYEAVSWRVGARPIVRDVSLRVAAGQVLALVGESGSGKTTLLRLANALLHPASGQVLVDGQATSALDGTALRRRTGYVPQTGGLLPHWTVRRNVALVPRLQGHAAPDDAARAALERCGLPDATFGARLPHELSGGQRQRAAFARAIAASQPLLLLDEPFGALDAASRDAVVETFRTLQRSAGCTAVLVTHDLAEAVRVADTIAVLREGRVEQHDTAGAVLDAPASDYVATLVARARAAASLLRA